MTIEPAVAPSPLRRSRRRRLAAIVAVVVVGVVATVLAIRQANLDASRRQDAVAADASDLVSSQVSRVLAVFSGAGGLVTTDGTVTQEAFDSFARGVFSQSPLNVLAYVPVIDDAQRAAYEARWGWPIVDRGGDTAVVAPRRPRYLPVTLVAPPRETTLSLRGFDLLGDPGRGAAALAAEASGQAVVTPPVLAQPSNQPAFFVVQPMFLQGRPVDTDDQRRNAIAGFVSSAYPGVNLLADLAGMLPSGTRVEVLDGAQRLAATDTPPTDGTMVELPVAGRSWRLVVDDRRGPSVVWPVVIAVLTWLLVAALWILGRRAARHERELDRSNAAVRDLGQLAQRLSRAATVMEVSTIVDADVPGVLGADGATFAVVDAAAGVVRILFGRNATPWLVTHFDEIPLDGATPAALAAREDRMVVLSSAEEWAAFPDSGLPPTIEPAYQSLVCVPLHDVDGAVVALLVASWARRGALEDRQTRSTLEAVAELCAETVERAALTDRRARRALAMADLAGRLSACRTLDDIAPAVADDVPGAVGASSAAVFVLDDGRHHLRMMLGDSAVRPGGTLEVAGRYSRVSLDVRSPVSDAMRRREPVYLVDRDDVAVNYPVLAADMTAAGVNASASLPLIGSDDVPLGLLMLWWSLPVVFDDSLRARLATISELCEQTVERARLYEHEHQVASDLQRRVLAPLPVVEGVRSAARYLPAERSLGIGGDWYEALLLPERRLAVVVGDVAGHGVDAVAEMAQLRSTMSALLRAGLEPAEVLHLTSEFVEHDGIVAASAAVAVVDLDAGTMTYVVAGHPPMLLRHADGTVEVLEGARRPLLGVPGALAVAITRPFTAGSKLVAYTDGLMERRGERFDVSLQRLVGELGEVGGDDVELLADDLIRRVATGRNVDDDIAVVVVERL